MDEIEIIKERAEKVIGLYESKKCRQSDVAEYLGIPENLVRKVTKAYGYDYGKEVTIENRTDRQKVQPYVNYNELKELLKYNI